MPYQFFTVPVLEASGAIEDLNKFLNSNKVVEIEKQFVVLGQMAYWSFCIKFLEGAAPNARNLKYPQKIDYREMLSEEEFKRFAKFRVIRKQIAADEGLPAFAIFTDAEMAEIAKLEVLSSENLLAMKGIGENKARKYGAKFIEV